MKPTQPNQFLKNRFTDQIDAWQKSSLLARPVNEDLSMRVVAQPNEALWQSCPIDNVQVRLLEFRGGENPRFTALMRLTPGADSERVGYWRKLEVMVLGGALQLDELKIDGGTYIRLPVLEHSLQMHHGQAHWPLEGLVYVAYAGGHYPKEDAEPRTISTHANDAWLPGPVEGIEVLPLHVHGSANAMLLRWTEAASFQPQLDPKGEEILVLDGALSDERGLYSAGCWLRNPEISWQHWSGTKGTVIFYKSGHFHAQDASNATSESESASESTTESVARSRTDAHNNQND